MSTISVCPEESIIFGAGPSDVRFYLKCCIWVIKILTDLGGFADQNRVRLRFVNGAENPVPGASNPQTNILKQFPPSRWDVFIAIFWTRFGSPTGNTDWTTGQPFQSGTYEEFLHAYRQCCITGKPRILLYRCDKKFNGGPIELDPRQLALLTQFWKDCGPSGKHPIYFRRFKTNSNFLCHLFGDLIKLYGRSDAVRRFGPAAELLDDFEAPGLPLGGEPQRLLEALHSHKDAAVSRIGKEPSGAAIESLRASIDAFYEGMNWLFYRKDEINPQACRETLDQIDEVLAMDEGLVEAFRERWPLVGVPSSLPGVQLLRGFLARRRSWAIADLKGLRDEVSRGASGTLLEKADTLTTSKDPLEVEDAFADILLHHRAELLQRIRSLKAGPKLVKALWQRAEALLVEELPVALWQSGNRQASIFLALSESPEYAGGFRIVRKLLESGEVPAMTRVAQLFRESGLDDPNGEDLEVLWRCLLVAHPKLTLRKVIARAIDLSRLWVLLIHPRVPFRTIRDSLLLFQGANDQDQQRLLFDCTRSRISLAVKRGRTADFEAIEELLLMLLSLEALTVKGYWGRLKDLCGLFVEQASRIGHSYLVDFEARAALSAEGPPPKEERYSQVIQSLPQIVQRHLAREGRYLHHIISARSSIALEALPHLWPDSLRPLLKRGINGALLGEICKKKEFSSNLPLATAILHQPKCLLHFADCNIPRLAKAELVKLVNDRGANLAVRYRAKAVLSALGS